MINVGLSINRQMVPRWRSLSNTIESQELSVQLRPTANHENWNFSQELTKATRAWRLSPTIISAGELVEASIVANREVEAIEAARFLTSGRSTAAYLVKHQAELLLHRTGEREAVAGPARNDTGQWRRRTRLHPEDALAWVEFALEQTVTGKISGASRAMSVALQLAPHNRHILRSASRLALHRGDKRQAYDIIARNAATPSDPWLLAAEVALAEVVQRPPRYFKQARQFLVEGAFRPRQISELAGAIATAELHAGSAKKARRMFGQSLLDPTGSALAQAEWASPRIGSELVAESRLEASADGFEARAFHLHRQGRLEEVLVECRGWARQERSSIRPFEFATTTAGQLGDFIEAENLAAAGLELRPNAPTLLNAMAFALGSLGKVDEAEKYLRRVVPPSDDPKDRSLLIAKANEGLISFRRGQIEVGRAHYLTAIDGFRRISHTLGVAVAALYLAREALLAGAPDARTLLAQAKESAKSFTEPHITLLVKSVERLAVEPAEGVHRST